MAIAKNKKKPEVVKRSKSADEIITEAFPPTDDERLVIHPVGEGYFRLIFWNKKENGIVRSVFIEVADGKAALWGEQ